MARLANRVAVQAGDPGASVACLADGHCRFDFVRSALFFCRPQSQALWVRSLVGGLRRPPEVKATCARKLGTTHASFHTRCHPCDG